jgi:hypothetical protein
MYLCRDHERLLAVKFPVGVTLGEFDSPEKTLIAMNLQLTDDIDNEMRLIKDLKYQQLLTVRAIQNLHH